METWEKLSRSAGSVVGGEGGEVAEVDEKEKGLGADGGISSDFTTLTCQRMRIT